MEENKTIKMKTPDREQNEKKMSYEQLMTVAKQLSEQNKQMAAQLQQSQLSYIFTVLDFIIRVGELDCKYPGQFDSEFSKYIFSEIEKKIYQLTESETTPGNKEGGNNEDSN